MFRLSIRELISHTALVVVGIALCAERSNDAQLKRQLREVSHKYDQLCAKTRSNGFNVKTVTVNDELPFILVTPSDSGGSAGFTRSQ